MRIALVALTAAISLAVGMPVNAGQMRGDAAIAARPMPIRTAPPARQAIGWGAGFSVQLVTNGSRGSGVHIGDGYVLTAAHVVAPGKSVVAVLDNGGRRSITLVWRNSDYDLAMVRLNDSSGVRAASLSCQTPRVGSTFTAYGSTLNTSFTTLQGRFLNAPHRVTSWRSVMMTERGVMKGMSGGGVIQEGRLVGVSVGVVEFLGGRQRAPGELGLVVPGTTICRLANRR